MLSLLLASACKPYRAEPAGSDTVLASTNGDDLTQRSEDLLNNFRLCNGSSQSGCRTFWPTIDRGDVATYEQRMADNAAVLAVLSLIAYRGEDEVNLWAKGHGFVTSLFLSEGTTQLYVFVHPEFNIVAFRGSERVLADWTTNLTVALTQPSKIAEKRDLLTIPGLTQAELATIRLHAGFQMAYDLVGPKLERMLNTDSDALDALINASGPLWLTGHSLGGALATTAAIKLKQNRGHLVDGVMSFGSPRVFNAATKILFDSGRFSRVHRRYVHGDDAVTKVPSGLVYAHFQDVSYLARFPDCTPTRGASTEPKNGEPDKTLTSTLQSFVGTAWKNIGRNSVFAVSSLCQIKDHCVVSYAQCALKNSSADRP